MKEHGPKSSKVSVFKDHLRVSGHKFEDCTIRLLQEEKKGLRLDTLEKMAIRKAKRRQDAGETMKEKVIELKEEVEEKVGEFVGSGRESAEEAAKSAAEEAQKEVEEAAKEAQETVEEAAKEAEERMDEVTEEAKTALEEAAKDAEKQDSRASTAGLEGFPSDDLEEIRNEIDEDLKGLDEGDGVMRLEAERQDIAEEEEETREAAAEAANDQELDEILAIEKEVTEEGDFRIEVGTEAEDAHGQTQPPDPEENNNQKKTTQENESNHPIETA